MADDDMQREFGWTWPALHMGSEDRDHFQPLTPCCGGSTLHFFGFHSPDCSVKVREKD